ncbi:histidine kinase dimerization/phospho-acceptor domain-containing protein [Heyndrickxia sp. NPDC080065]|uniref:sensor histidine kinase n=1 Tax=Heyndrickxia sp. NPDC080065 TaxID=3390568 RepID=UPI003CFF3701
MVTKWKSRMIYFTIALLLFTFGLTSIVSLITQGHEYLFKNYFDTDDFKGEFQSFTQKLSMYELNAMTNDEAKNHLTVTADEIMGYRDQYGYYTDRVQEITNEYQSNIDEALSEKNQTAADVYLTERDKKLEDIKKIFKNDNYVRNEILKEKEKYIDEYFRNKENDLPELYEAKKAFKYYLTDRTTGEVYTNIYSNNEKLINSQFTEKEMAYIRHFASKDENYLTTDTPPGLDATAKKLVGKIGVLKSAPKNVPVISNYHRYPQKQTAFYLYTIGGLVALFLSILIMKKLQPFQLTERIQKYYRMIPLDICLLILIGIASYGAIAFLGRISNLYLNDYFPIGHFFLKFLMSVLFVYITVVQLMLLSDRIKEFERFKAEWEKSILYKMYTGIKEAFLIRSIGTQTIILLGIFLAFIIGAVYVAREQKYLYLYSLLFLLFVIPSIIMIVKRAGYFNRILKNTSELAQGNLEPDLKIIGRSPLADLAGNINQLKHGVKTSKKEQAKSERLKTELITNVSHDLRTPLTSIITYTELLKSKGLSEDERTAYVEIIDRKSKRLKVLIDDLFEASKMASGSIELVKKKVDMIQLLEQALAEYDETIKQSTLQFRISTPEKPVYAYVDGQKFWRVFDNLIGNILKYALENTRVYISIHVSNDKVVITFKNVTKYELSENSDELFERFKRGDTSRHTDGSGLGLAIAKSIIDLHEGSMEMEVDGDLFKVTIRINILE